MINKNRIPLIAKNKRHTPMSLRQRVARLRYNQWSEDDNDIAQSGLDTYQDYDARDRGGLRKIWQPTDYETAGKEIMKWRDKKKGQQVPKHPL